MPRVVDKLEIFDAHSLRRKAFPYEANEIRGQAKEFSAFGPREKWGESREIRNYLDLFSTPMALKTCSG